MSKFTFIIILLFSTICSFAQSAFRYDFSTTQGFIVCNTKDYPEATKWKVQIFDRKYTGPNNYSEKEVFSKDLLNENYFRIDETYLNPDSSTYAILLTGYNEKNDKIVKGEHICYAKVPDGNDWYNDKYIYQCMSNTYAWQICANMKMYNGTVTNSGYLDLESYRYAPNSRYRAIDEFVYFTEDLLNNLCTTDKQKIDTFYNINCTSLLSNNTSYNTVILRNIDQSYHLHDPSGK